jgi:uncharacterized protein DUF642
MRSNADRRGVVRRGSLPSAAGAEALTTTRRCFGLLLGACLLGVLALPRAAQAAPIMDPDTGHYYEAVARNAGISWNAANAAANARTFMGMHGHLATITSAAENSFILQQFPEAVAGYYCLGGIQSHGLLDPAAGWQWVTGEPWSYTNWHVVDGTEPNDYYGVGTGPQDENKLQFWAQDDAPWNDIRPFSVESDGYVVEYEPDPSGDPPTITGYAVDLPGMPSPSRVPPGTLLRVTGTNLGNEGTVLFDGDPLPAAVASWNPAEIRLWVPTAPSYPFMTHVRVTTNRRQAAGGDFTITPPTPGQDNLLANGSFEFPDSSASPEDSGYTYGQPIQPDYDAYNGYSIPGWRIPFGTIDVVRDGWQQAAGQGKQCIGLVGSAGAGIIQQTFFTQSGKTYIFSGWIAHNPGIADARALVSLSHGFWTEKVIEVLYSQGYTTPDSMGWHRISFPFKAPAAQTTLMIQDISGQNDHQGFALDGLKVTPTSN